MLRLFDLLFQFHKGTIRTNLKSVTLSHLSNFNSIKVRLEHSTDWIYEAVLLFQFHKGTIRTFGHKYTNYYLIKFQFHKGTIRTCSRTAFFKPSYEFQFHKGTIRTKQNWYWWLVSNYFNSIKVRLELFGSRGLSRGMRNFNSIKVRLELMKKKTKISQFLISIP